MNKIINLEIIDKLMPNLAFKSKNFNKLKKYISNKSLKYKLKKDKIYYFKNIGKIIFPYVSMGKIKSYDLIFSANEFVVFFLYRFLKKYNNRNFVGDFGANLGLHSIILSKYGFTVEAFEPDPFTFKKLKKNIDINKANKVKLKNNAIYNRAGKINFTRVKNNLTGSHLGKLKKSYGELEIFKVNVLNFKNLVSKFDLIKLDVESAEAKVLTSLNKKFFVNRDFIVEIGNRKNAKKIFNFLKKNKLSFYSQKNNFKKVKNFNQVPFSHHEGALLISQNFENFSNFKS